LTSFSTSSRSKYLPIWPNSLMATDGFSTQLMVGIPLMALKMRLAPSIFYGSGCANSAVLCEDTVTRRRTKIQVEFQPDRWEHVWRPLAAEPFELSVDRRSDLDISFPIVALYSLNKMVKYFRSIPKTRLYCAKTIMAESRDCLFSYSITYI